jgi:photosystem II stability/assembly factor-like uncharacterized protein
VFGILRVIRLFELIGGLGEFIVSGPVFFLLSRARAVAKFVLAVLALYLGIAAPAEGQTWQRIGPPGGMVMSVAAAADGTVFLGTPDGHVFASGDRGEHWELRGRAGSRLDGVVQRIVPDGRNAKRLLAAVWFRNEAGGGVFESVDAGSTWKLAGLGDEAVRALEQSPSDAKVWIAGTRSGVFRSMDDARTWQRITRADDPELQNIDSLAFDPRDAQTIYVGTYHLPWKTTDGGKTWHSISEGMIDDSDIMSLRIDAKDPRRIFSSACSGIYRSENGGASWTKLQGIPYSSRRTQQIVQDPADSQTLYAATTEGLWMTSDYGETWKRITSRDIDANSAVVLTGQRGKVILVGTSAQGILRSSDGGASFAVSNEGFSHRVIASLAVDAQNPQRLLTVAEGYRGKLQASDDGGRTWSEFAGKAPQKPVEQVFWSPAAWWATFAGGGLGHFDPNARVWRAVIFRETASPPKTRQPARRRQTLRAVVPHVRAFVQAGGKTLVATDNGVWELMAGRMEFRRFPAKGLPSAVSYLSSESGGTLLAIANGELWFNDTGGEWKRIATETSKVTGLLWVERYPRDPAKWLLGTQRGVFMGGPDADWRLLGNGLAATASAAPACTGSRCLIAMSNGGLYESSDGLKSWLRVDTDAERGSMRPIFAGEKGFIVASEQEGILVLPVSDGH